MTKEFYEHCKLVRNTHRNFPHIDLESIKGIVTYVETKIMQRERLNEETTKEQYGQMGTCSTDGNVLY
jgi:CRISPR/Cas system CMR subunit Cmr6 (Cas7 group RAMP superfamily)